MARQKPNTEVVFPGTETALPIDALKATIAMELAAGLSDAEGIKGDAEDITAATIPFDFKNKLFRWCYRISTSSTSNTKS